MLKPFQHMWKNAIDNKFQIVLRRSVSSVSSVVQQLHVNQSDVSFNQLNNNNKSQSRTLLSDFHTYENRYITRCISKTVDSSNLKRSENVSTKYKAMEANLKWRSDPVITTLETPQFKTILRKNILDLVSIFQKHNYEIRIAGGAVR